jgi:membrane-associated phospholipid phosphatase
LVTAIKAQRVLIERSDSKGIWLNPVDSLVLLYQAVIALVIATGNLPADLKVNLIEQHAVIFTVLLLLLWLFRRNKNPVVQFIKDIYPLAAMLFFYKEIGLLVHQYFDWTLDEGLIGIDDEMGRVGRRIWNFQQFYPPVRLLNEFFSIGYSFYFFLMPLSALVIYFKAPLSKFRAFMFSLSFTYYFCYLLFIFLPAESPRFYMPGLREALKGYWVSDWLQAAVEKNAFPGGSFPSSHIAASIICIMAYPYLGRFKKPVIFLTLALFAGTIYGRYHYFADVVAGSIVGTGIYFLGPWLERKWPLVWGEEEIAHG